MIRLRLTFVAVALLAAFAGRSSARAPAPLDGLDAYIRNAMAAWQIPGLAIAVVKDDAVVFMRAYGVRQVGTDARVDENTLFEFGSTTKAYTATALAMLVSDGKVRWDDPVTKYVPWLEFADPFVTRRVTIRDLLSHRVADGWGGATNNFLMSHRTGPELLRALAWRPPAGTQAPSGLPGFPAPVGSNTGAEFRSRFVYENANYYAAGEVIEAVTGEPWQAFIQSRIFRPLGMTSARTSVYDVWHRRAVAPCVECGVGSHIVSLDDALVTNVAVRHRIGEPGPETTPVWPLDNNPGGSILGSVKDAARWLRFQAAGGSFGGTRLLSARAFDETHSAQVSIPVERQPNLRPGAGNLWAYGLGWQLTDYRGRKASLHGGGFLAYIGILHDEHLGVMVLANLPSDLREALVFRVFDAYVGAPPRDWSREMLDDTRRRADEARKRRTAVPAPVPAAPPLALPAYIGTYGHPAYGDLFVTHESGALVLRFDGGQIGDLMSLGKNEFRVTWRGPDRYGSVLTFTVRGERPEQLTLQFPAGTFTRK